MTGDRQAEHNEVDVKTEIEWINVNDRLPDEYSSVLVVSEGSVYSGFLQKSGEWYLDNSLHIRGIFVSHWAVMPEPPKTEAL